MNFLETILAIAERGEKVVVERATCITTNKFSYVRLPNGDWEQREIPSPADNKAQFQPLPEEVPQIKRKK